MHTHTRTKFCVPFFILFLFSTGCTPSQDEMSVDSTQRSLEETSRMQPTSTKEYNDNDRTSEGEDDRQENLKTNTPHLRTRPTSKEDEDKQPTSKEDEDKQPTSKEDEDKQPDFKEGEGCPKDTRAVLIPPNSVFTVPNFSENDKTWRDNKNHVEGDTDKLDHKTAGRVHPYFKTGARVTCHDGKYHITLQWDVQFRIVLNIREITKIRRELEIILKTWKKVLNGEFFGDKESARDQILIAEKKISNLQTKENVYAHERAHVVSARKQLKAASQAKGSIGKIIAEAAAFSSASKDLADKKAKEFKKKLSAAVTGALDKGKGHDEDAKTLKPSEKNKTTLPPGEKMPAKPVTKETQAKEDELLKQNKYRIYFGK